MFWTICPHYISREHGQDILSLFFSLLSATASAFQHSHLAKDLEVFVTNCVNNPRSCSARVDEMRVLKLFVFFVPTMFSGIPLSKIQHQFVWLPFSRIFVCKGGQLFVLSCTWEHEIRVFEP